MRHIRLILTAISMFAVIFLTACTLPWQTASFTSITDHSSNVNTSKTDLYQASTYEDLRSVLLDMIESYQASSTIQVSAGYAGDLTADLNDAIYDVWKNDPLGAYAVDFIMTDISKRRSFSEITVDIYYRRSEAEVNSIRYARGVSGLSDAIYAALDSYDQKLILKVSALTELPDCKAIVDAYCREHLDRVMETPEISVSFSPDSGATRIIEILFHFSNTAANLKTMQTSVQAALDSAVNYVSYRSTPEERAELLYTFLSERFEYAPGSTETPMFSLLCTGIINSETISKAYAIACSRSGIECTVVSGNLNGGNYYWNIVSINGVSRHIDLYRDILEGVHSPQFLLDDSMIGYSWDHSSYPACEKTEPEPRVESAGANTEKEPDVDDTQESGPAEGNDPDSSNDPSLDPSAPADPGQPAGPEPSESTEGEEEGPAEPPDDIDEE